MMVLQIENSRKTFADEGVYINKSLIFRKKRVRVSVELIKNV